MMFLKLKLKNIPYISPPSCLLKKEYYSEIILDSVTNIFLVLAEIADLIALAVASNASDVAVVLMLE